MPPNDDLELLREYATKKSEPAFEKLVDRHIHFVYSAALRQVRDPLMAEEVAQATFVILARKAGGIKKNAVLSGWLFNTVRFVAAAEFRRAARRRKYEQEACMESLIQKSSSDPDWQHVFPLLDECLAQLSEKDRQAVLLRFFEQKSFTEVGALLGTNEDAATKRAKRAVEKLRQLFIKRGVVLSTAAIAGLLAANGVQAAPASLSATVSAMAVIHGATATTSTATLIQGALKLMAWTKLKTTAVTLGVLLALGTATVTVTTIHDHGNASRIKYLPDGFIRVLSADYATKMSYSAPAPKPWQQRLARTLPSSVASRFNWWLGTSASMSSGGDPGVTNLFLLIASEQPTLRHHMTMRSLVVFDEQGNQSLAAMGGSTLGNDDGKRFKTIQSWMVSAFPRRSKTLGLRFLEKPADTNDWSTAAEFQIPNPAYHDYPVWTPEPLPATKTDGDLAVTLAGLLTGLKLDEPSVQPQVGELPATRAVFHVELPGHPGQVWLPKAVEISDATGNKWSPYPLLTFVKHTDEAEELTFAGTLWPGEAAWKLRVEFSRTAGFDPDETWTVRGVAVPGAKQLIDLNETTTIGESTLKLVAITGAEKKQAGDMEWIANAGQPNLSIRTTPWTKGQRLSLISMTDDRGRKVGIQPGADWGNGNAAFGLSIPPGARTLDCAFALHKSRFVEFLAKPEITAAK